MQERSGRNRENCRSKPASKGRDSAEQSDFEALESFKDPTLS
jgi:hypothetical protein